MPTHILTQASRLLARRLDELARVSDERRATTRTFLSPAMHRANDRVGRWMRACGLKTRVDSVGNLIGRIEGPGGARTLLLGSHLDTVRNAGRFDGPLGVLLPVAALEVIRARKIQLPYAVEVLGFSEEEGVRFGSGYLGSKGYTGRLGSSELRLRDDDGLSLAEVLANELGGRFSLPASAHKRGELLGYVEVHIEQGPVLEARRMAAGVVSAIVGQTRCQVVFGGEAGHAGTTPMRLRRDALAGAAQFILEVEGLARSRKGLVATVGRIAARPGAANVIPAAVELSLDVRHASEGERRRALASLRRAGRRMARDRGLSFALRTVQDNAAVVCSPELTGLLAQSVRACEGRCLALASGAGHDGVVVCRLTPVAMLFVRCRRGLSHHPDEHVSESDLEAALRILVDFLLRLARR